MPTKFPLRRPLANAAVGLILLLLVAPTAGFSLAKEMRAEVLRSRIDKIVDLKDTHFLNDLSSVVRNMREAVERAKDRGEIEGQDFDLEEMLERLDRAKGDLEDGQGRLRGSEGRLRDVTDIFAGIDDGTYILVDDSSRQPAEPEETRRLRRLMEEVERRHRAEVKLAEDLDLDLKVVRQLLTHLQGR